MIAKLAVWGRTRDEAIDRLKRALDEYEVSGITTTLPFFREVVRDEEFVSARLDTGFIARFNERRADREVELRQVESDLAAIAAGLSYALRKQQTAVPTGAHTNNRWKMSGRKL
jgi:acetyl-CoA carboxylase biotin carboxylase subunit